MSRGRRLGACLVLLVFAAADAAGDATNGSPEEIRRAWQSGMDGRQFSAHVLISVKIRGRVEERRLLIWRDDVDGDRERLYARFESPYDLRNLAILYIENGDRSNDYFMYQPELDRIRRISDAVARQDIYGVDLEYLGFGIAQSEPTEVERCEFVEVEDRRLVRVRERAQRWNPRFDTRVNWIDPTTMLLVRTEHYRHDRLRLLGRTVEVGEVQGVTVPKRIVFERPMAEEIVTMVVEGLDFQAGIPPDVFSTLNLLK